MYYLVLLDHVFTEQYEKECGISNGTPGRCHAMETLHYWTFVSEIHHLLVDSPYAPITL